MSRKAATIRSKTEERKRRRDLVWSFAGLPNDVTFLTGRYEALERDPARPTDARFCLLVSLDPQKFDYGFASAQDDRLQVMRWVMLGSLREGAGAARRLKESACRIKQAQTPKSRRLLPSNAPHLPPPSRREAKVNPHYPPTLRRARLRRSPRAREAGTEVCIAVTVRENSPLPHKKRKHVVRTSFRG